ncbi:MAG: type II toxin-antitoxin system VapC family toxin [Acidimicrobiia bacterium]|nr:type II toxin-antitoxin system VapC family toxin [Acidimicrobiia bacterium]
MTRLLVDTSVLIKWFHELGESELDAARALRAAHVADDVDVHILDLALYEVGNVLTRALHWPADDVADQLDDLLAIVGTPVVPSPEWMRDAAGLASQHGLTFYDATWAAAARGLGVTLVSADRELLAARLAESVTDTVHRLAL